MSLPHILTHPLGLPRGRTSRRGERARQQLALLFLHVRGARPARGFCSTRRNTNTEASVGDRLARDGD